MKPRILLCGAGRWGRNYARVLSRLGLLALVSDPDDGALDSVRKLIEGFAVLTPAPLSELLRSADNANEFDAVVIATPAESHYALALDAIEYGRDVLVEKPFALDSQAAEHLVGAAAERGVKLQVGHLFELNPGVLKLREWIEEGRLGRLDYLFSHQLSPGRIRKKEDVLLSLAPHDVSILLTLSGKMPRQVNAFGNDYAEPDVAGMSVVHLSFNEDEHLRAHLHVSWLHPEKVRRVVAVGSKGAAVLDDGASDLVLYGRTAESANPFPSRPVDSFRYLGTEPLRVQCEAFRDYVERGVEPVTTGKNALRVMAVLDAARRSLLAGSLPTRVSYEE